MDAQIRKLAVRCHVSSASNDDRERLSRLFHGPIEVAFESALAAAGLDGREEICVRRLVVPSRLWLGMTDAALLSAWTAVAIDRLRLALEAGPSDEVVRYRSRTDAVIDAIRGTARGSTDRSWAWREVGLPVLDQAEAAVRALLLDHPPAIVPVFRALAQDRAFRSVVTRLDDRTMAAIIDAALAHAGRSTTVGAVADIVSSAHQESADNRADAQLPRACAAVRRSAAVVLSRPGQSVVRSSALTLLAFLDAEPALLSGRPESVAVMAARATRALDRGRAVSADGASDPADGTESSISRDPSGPTAEGRWTARAMARTRQAPPPTSVPTDKGGDLIAGPAIHRSAAGQPTPADARDDLGDDNTDPLDARLGAFTEWAGLLFLVHIARDLDLARGVLDDPALADRPLAWVLQQLAMTLVPAPAEDAAVRAFAGLPPVPDADATAARLDDVREPERAPLLAWARAIGAAACARLEQPTSDEVLYALCARRGEIVADPGWIEVRLSLEQVSTDVRGAGLDLDPDYVDWLGVVMKIVYA